MPPVTYGGTRWALASVLPRQGRTWFRSNAPTPTRSCRRKTTEIVTNDLGIGPEDREAMRLRLREQGVLDAHAIAGFASPA